MVDSSSFSKLVNQIKMDKEVSKQNLQQMIIKEYKILRLTPDGEPEDVDFVTWASCLNNRHPIARAYQDLRKNHFNKLRKE